MITARRLDILIVDDDPEDIMLLRDVIRRGGGRALVRAATDHAAVRAVIAQHGLPDVCLLDYHLGAATALDVMADLRALGADIPVIVITDSAEAEVDDTTMRAGASDFMPKASLTPDAVWRAMRHAVERSVATRAVQESRAFLRAALDAVPYIACVLDRSGYVTAVNSAWRRSAVECDMSTRDSGIGMHYDTIAARGVTDGESGAVETVAGLQAVRAGHVDECAVEYRMVAPAGESWFRMVIAPFADDVAPRRLVILHEDVTRRVRAAEAMRSSEAQLRGVLRQMPAVVWRSTAELTLVGVDGGLRDDVGATPNVVGASIETLAVAAGPTALLAHREALGGESAEYACEVGEASYHVSLEPLRDDAGSVAGVVGVALNVSDLQRSERVLREGQKMEALGQLAGGVAHDFNNLLTSIQLNVGSLADALPLDADGAAELRDISFAVSQASKLTRQLLAFGRKQVFDLAVVDATVLLHDVESLLRRLMPEHVALSVLPGTVPLPVLADQTQLVQVVLNLAINARDAMPRGGTLLVEGTLRHIAEDDAPLATSGEAVPAGTYVAITVSDSGTGISPEHQARIFEPFFTTKETGQGTGLGLATVHGIVHQLGGRIVLESAVGHGSQFTLLLPHALRAVTPVTVEAATTQGKQETVLVVEDEESVRRLVVHVLTRHGYQVREARHGGDALLLLEKADIHADLVLTDAVMPEIGGGELVRLMRERYPEVPVLMMSGYPSETELTEVGSGARPSFLSKPFSAGDLLAAVRASLAGAAAAS